jgi:hypothetical protein
VLDPIICWDWTQLLKFLSDFKETKYEFVMVTNIHGRKTSESDKNENDIEKTA